MTDDRPTESEADSNDAGGDTDARQPNDAADTGAGGLGRPGGGPQKVVSSTSVDDILDSLQSNPPADRGPTAKTVRTSEPDPLESVSPTDTSEDDTSADDSVSDTSADDSVSDTSADGSVSDTSADGSVSDTSADGSEVPSPGDDEPSDEPPVELTYESDETATAGAADSSDSDALEADDSTDRDETADDATAGTADDATAGTADETTSPADDATVDVDAAVSTLSAARAGDDVTGSDVRAAEHGEGREATPDIDELDLSLDDLDATETASPPTRSSGPSSADGPLAGTLEREDPAGDTATDDEDEEADSGGVFGRIRGLFSR
ncbi:prolipoprotein diacylglyceryl transferase [Natronobiforma cellulositropha]|uniref:hypothetical protein n=1 Tax=Natronobiforma cellulositropha TaxID=1679076 RepID=UPI0021D5915A|nr:hypothetical protein [Natronobiforma cellulositropha]